MQLSTELFLKRIALVELLPSIGKVVLIVASMRVNRNEAIVNQRDLIRDKLLKYSDTAILGGDTVEFGSGLGKETILF